MKKTFILITVILTIFLLLTGCGAGNSRQTGKGQGKADAGTGQIRLKSLEVYSNAVNEDRLYHVKYPYYYYAFTSYGDGSAGAGHLDLPDAIKPGELSGEADAEYFVEYVKNLPEGQKGDNDSYYVICRYIDGEGNEESIYRRGYDVFPEGWDEFIAKYNEICGGEYLFTGDQIQTVTPEFLTEVFGVTDEDVRGGTLQDVIDVRMLNMIEITGLFRIEDALNGYYAEIKEPLIEPHRPRELISVDSTQEEYDAFLEEFFGKIGAGQVTEPGSDQDHFRYFYLPESGKGFYTAKTSDLDQLPTSKRDFDDYYFLELDAHMEDMVMSADFIYSGDGKFILVPMDCGTDIMIAFCE